jgi:6,7-dimethyl-8-ribityllumazine synthase
MSKELTGNLNGQDLKIGIIVSRFNEFITDKLLEGCIDSLVRNGVDKNNILVAKVPGAFEIPFFAAQFTKTKNKFDAVICLGAVIKGSTDHFTFISSEVTKGVASAGINSGIPVIYGVITPDTLEQAIERAGTKAGNKGREAALAAIESANLNKKIRDL